MLVPPLSNESRTRNDSPVPERLFELSNLLKRTLSPADHAFALRAALEAHAMGADESAVVATAAACGLDRAGEALEPLLTLEELAAASRISVGLLNVRAVAHSSDAVADGMLALASASASFWTTHAFTAAPTTPRSKHPTNTSSRSTTSFWRQPAVRAQPP